MPRTYVAENQMPLFHRVIIDKTDDLFIQVQVLLDFPGNHLPGAAGADDQRVNAVAASASETGDVILPDSPGEKTGAGHQGKTEYTVKYQD